MIRRALCTTNLWKKRTFEGSPPKSLSKSNGSGTIVGYVYDADKQRIAIRIPRVYEVPGAPHELLSVSNIKKYGFSFHFTPDVSYMITPTREKVVMILVVY